jgi:hypothetical protein
MGPVPEGCFANIPDIVWRFTNMTTEDGTRASIQERTVCEHEKLPEILGKLRGRSIAKLGQLVFV